MASKTSWPWHVFVPSLKDSPSVPSPHPHPTTTATDPQLRSCLWCIEGPPLQNWCRKMAGDYISAWSSSAAQKRQLLVTLLEGRCTSIAPSYHSFRKALMSNRCLGTIRLICVYLNNTGRLFERLLHKYVNIACFFKSVTSSIYIRTAGPARSNSWWQSGNFPQRQQLNSFVFL